jgi:DNA-binding CsgD family transcriptional regulator
MRHTRETTKKMYEQVYELYKSGMERKEIAKQMGYNPQYISQIISYMNGSTQRTATEEEIQQMIELRQQGKTIKEISEIVGFSYGTVQKNLVKAGYKKYGVDRSVETPTVYSDPEEFVNGTVTMQTRKPQVHEVVIKGKKYQDITELVAGI